MYVQTEQMRSNNDKAKKTKEINSTAYEREQAPLSPLKPQVF